MKSISILILLLNLSLSTYAQNCGAVNTTIELTTQTQVDEFQMTYNCTVVLGNLKINGPDINNLEGLLNLTAIEGYLFITNNAVLSNVKGLQNLTSIGGFLSITSNTVLSDLDGLQNLTSIGTDVAISTNAALLNIDGLQNLTSTGGDGDFTISKNAVLSNVDALKKLTSIGRDFTITSNAVLLNVDGLQNIRSIGGYLDISRNGSLENVDGLQNLTTIGGDGDLIIRTNTVLSEFCGLHALANTSPNGVISEKIINNAIETDLAAIASGEACSRVLGTSKDLPAMPMGYLLVLAFAVLGLAYRGVRYIA